MKLFRVGDGVQLPAPNAPFPIPGTLTTPDPNNPEYLQGVANALNAVQSNLGVQPRFRNDWSVFSKVDYRDSKDDRFYLSLNWNRFDSPGGFILGTQTALFGKSTLANAFVLISPGMNNYNALFVPRQRRLRNGLAFQTAYTFSKNIMSYGVDFNNQFDFSNTHAPYLLEQRHRLSIAAIYESDFAFHLS